MACQTRKKVKALIGDRWRLSRPVNSIVKLKTLDNKELPEWPVTSLRNQFHIIVAQNLDV